MKIIAFILSIYILALNFAPCADSDKANNINTEITQSQDHEHNSSDLCSPFCHCQCCQVFATHFFNYDLDFKNNKIISNQIFFHIDNLGKEITFPKFQPPRV